MGFFKKLFCRSARSLKKSRPIAEDKKFAPSSNQFLTTREITDIIIHCSASPDNRDIGSEEIRAWHTDPKPRGNGWSRIGYHFIIRRDGTIENSLPLKKPGIHCRGKNSKSIGICIIGNKKFTEDQYSSLRDLVRVLLATYPDVKVRPHSWYPSAIKQGKTCPNIDIYQILAEVL